MKFYRLVKYDIRNGILGKSYLYLINAFLCVIFVCNFYINMLDGQREFEGERLTIMNILLYLFEGKEPFSPEYGNAFVFPVTWLVLFLFAAYITLDYPYSNMTQAGIQVLIRVKSRGLWWAAKCIWVFCGTLLYFAVGYLVTWIICLAFRIDISWEFAESVNVHILNMELENITSGQAVMLVLIFPIMVALAMNYIQLFLGLFLDRIYCFLVIAVILFASTYFSSPVLVGNYAMIKRSVLCQEQGVSLVSGIWINSILIAANIIGGFWRIRRYDILKKST